MSGASGFFVSGRLVRDPHIIRTDGRVVALYTVATRDGYRDGGGEFKRITNFVPVVSTGAQAEADARFLQANSVVAIRGRIESWYKPSSCRGGISLKVLSVDYLSPSASAADTTADDEVIAGHAHDQWVDDYAAAEAQVFR